MPSDLKIYLDRHTGPFGFNIAGLPKLDASDFVKIAAQPDVESYRIPAPSPTEGLSYRILYRPLSRQLWVAATGSLDGQLLPSSYYGPKKIYPQGNFQ